MSKDWVSQGLDLYLRRDFVGAARLWLRAHECPDDSDVAACYIAHLRAVAPEALQAARASEPAEPPSTQNIGRPAGVLGEDGQVGVCERDDLPSHSGPEPSGAPVDGWGHVGQGCRLVTTQFLGLRLVRALPSSQAEPASPPSQHGAMAPTAGLVARLRELCGLDDFTQALQIAEQILAFDPHHEEAATRREYCLDKLMRMFESKVGGAAAVPRVAIDPSEVIWQDLDPRSAFVLSQVDGVSTNEEIAEVCGIGRLDSFQILAALVQGGVITLSQ